MDSCKKTILVVDDEEDIRLILSYNLSKAGYRVLSAESAEKALALEELPSVNLILLDVMMEGMSGFDMAARLKESPCTAGIPVIFLTALDSEDDKVAGFEAGADDYIAKPFSIREMLSRVKAVLKRSAASSEDFLPEGFRIDEAGKTAIIDGKRVVLSHNEFEILCLLTSHHGQVFSREELLSKVWSDDVVVTDRSVDVAVARLRKKIGSYGSHIVSRHGYGYLWEG